MKSQICIIVLIGAAILRCQVTAAASDTCSGGKEWQQCATACPLTCDNYDTAPVNCTESCIEGCACPEGKVELDRVCVEPSTCARCSQCEEGQQCSAVLSADCVNVICKDPLAVSCSSDVPLSCPTNTRCLTHNTTGTSFCLESCFMQNGGCSSDQACHSVRTQEPCNPLLQSCFTTTCHETKSDEGVCPVGWELNECGSLCQRTCEDYLTNSHKDCSDDTCAMPACVCPEGLVEYEDRCVDPLECHSLIYNAVVGWEKVSYHVYEDTPHGMVELCATVYTASNIECPISFPFDVRMTASGPDEVSSTIRFGACEKRQCTSVTIVNDIKFEGNESILVTLERTSGLDSRIILTPADARINIIEDESIRHRCYTGLNCEGPSFLGATAKDCCVETDDDMSYSEDGECTIRQCIVHGFSNDAMYNVVEGEVLNTTFGINVKGNTHFYQLPLPGTITSIPNTADTTDFETIEYQIKSGSSVSLVTIDDVTVEYDETVTLKFEHLFSSFMAHMTAMGEFIRDTATVNIIDNDLAVVRLKPDYTVSEDDTDVTVCAVVETSSGPADCPVGFEFSVSLSTVDQTAEDNKDFDVVATIHTIRPCEVITCIKVPIIDDTTVEEDEYFIVEMEGVPNLHPRINLEDTRATITVLDNDGATFGLKSTYSAVREDETDVEVCVELKSPPNGCPVAFPFNLILDVQSSTAVSPDDYYTVNSTVLTFEPCEDEQCITIRIMDDETLERREVFTVSLERPPGLTENIELVNTTRKVSIIDNDMILVGFSRSSVAFEDHGKAKVCVEVISPASYCPAAIPFELMLVTEPDSAIPGVDYMPVTSILTFEVCDREVCVDIPLFNDIILEDTEKFNVIVTKLPGTNERIILEERERLYTIVDVDDATVEFESLYYSVDEGSSVEVCAVVTDPDLPCAIDFEFDFKVEVNASSADSSDYEVEITTLHFDVCEQQKCITILTVDDCNLEAREEVFKVTLKRPKWLDRRIRLNTTAASVAIHDNDYIFISLDESVYGVRRENDGVVRVCIVFNDEECSSTFPFGIHFQTHSDSAAPNEDYRPVNTIVEFGSSQSERCVDVRIINDTQVEQSESFDVSLTPTTNLDDRIILVQDSAKVIIRNDDEATVGFTSDSVFVVEERGKVEVCVKIFSPDIERPVSYPFEISVSTTAGNADAGVDYIPPEGIFRFSAGEKEDCFDIEILDDEFLEPLETFTVSLMPTESLGNEIVFSRDTIVVRIIDRDVAHVGFVDMGYEADEGDGSVLVCVEVKSSTCIVNFAFNITFKTVDGSADSPEDYVAQSTTLTFAPCQLLRCVDVVLEDDCVLEDTEAFNIRLETIVDQDRRITIDRDTGNETQLWIMMLLWWVWKRCAMLLWRMLAPLKCVLPLSAHQEIAMSLSHSSSTSIPLMIVHNHLEISVLSATGV